MSASTANSLAPEQMKQISDLAQKLVWKNPNINVLDSNRSKEYNELASILQEQISKYNIRGRLILPDLSAFNNETVSIYSDYAGESTGDHHTYSFLTCAFNNAQLFVEAVKDIRVKHALIDKEISFKDFGMGQLRRALPDYLNAANNLLHGFLFTVVVDKKVVSLFGPNEKKTREKLVEQLEAAGLGEWKAEGAEKLLRIVHTVAFLSTLLARPGQKLFWMTDNDTICANEKLHKKALELWGRALNHYDKEKVYPVTGGASPFSDGNVAHKDLLSLADITASSLEHYLTRKNKSNSGDIEVKAGSEAVLQWLANNGLALSKMTIFIRLGENGDYDVGNLELTLTDPPKDAIYVPVSV